MAKWRRNIASNKLIFVTIFGAVGGIVVGTVLKNTATKSWTQRKIAYIKFPGEIIIRLINCIILPLVTCSIITASCSLSKSGRVGLIALFYYLMTTTIAIALCVTLVQLIRPGEIFASHNITEQTLEVASMTIDVLLDLLRNLIPDNIVKACLSQYQTVLEKPPNAAKGNIPMHEWNISYQYMPGINILGLVFFSLLLGTAIGHLDKQGKPLLDFFNCLSTATMRIMNLVISIGPLCMVSLIAGRILEVDDFGVILKRLGAYIVTVFIGLTMHGYMILPLLYFIITRRSPYKVIFHMIPAFVTACGTSSSTATVPVTMNCLDNVGTNSRISRFIVPIGAAINMDGIALYETIGALFIIQLRGLQFSLLRVIVISITCTISCIGAAGLPNGGYMMLIMVLNSVGVPIEDVTLIIAIDCFVDRFRTTINIITDALGSGIIEHLNKNSLKVSPEEERFMYGIGTGVVTGLAAFLTTSRPTFGLHIGFFTHISIFTGWFIKCRTQMLMDNLNDSKENNHPKLQNEEDKSKLEEA